MSYELLYDVFNQPRLVPSTECPENMEDKTVVIKSSDGESFEVDGEGASMSGVIRQHVAQFGLEVPLNMQMKKGIVSKVVEYLKFHKDTPPGEIRAPISGELSDCGALKWDEKFISVEKDTLFEIMVAAISLDIPSLVFLCAAKAILLIKDKDAIKLRKDFGLTSDLPADQEGELNWDFLEKQKALKATPDEEQGLAGITAIMTGLAAAAEKNNIYFGTSDSAEAGPSSASLKSFKAMSWRAAVCQDWRMLMKAPEEVTADRDLIYNTILASRGASLQFAAEELKSDRKLVLAAVKVNGDALWYASPALREDRSFVLEAVLLDGTTLEGASENLRKDRGLVLEASRSARGSAMKGAASGLQGDRAFVLECAALDAEAYRYAAEDLRHDSAFALEVAKVNGLALQYMLPKFRADKAIVAAAVASDPTAASSAHTSARSYLGRSMPWDSEVAHLAQRKEEDGGRMGVGSSGVGPEVLGIELAPAMYPGVELSRGAEGSYYYYLKANKSIQFSALSSCFANMGQGNYIASNMVLDKFPFYQRPVIEATTVMWGAIGHIGMRFKAFASADFLNATPEILMTVEDASKVLHVTCTSIMVPDTPEWYTGALNVDGSMLVQTAGVHQGYSETSPGAWKQGQQQAKEPDKRSTGQPEEPPPLEDRRATQSTGPLGGWPQLGAPPDLQEGRRVGESLAEGGRVRLVGLKSKSGTTGVLLQHFEDGKGGKWKVQLDGNTGSKGVALLKCCYLQALLMA